MNYSPIIDMNLRDMDREDALEDRAADRFVAPDKLAQLVRPFIGTGKEIHRDDGSRIDVLHIMNTVDASIRGVDASGIDTTDHDGFCRFIPWAEVRSVTVTDRLGEVTYRNAAARWPVWGAGR